MIIEESIEIHAPLAVVWRVFSRMEDWERWNTVCENGCLIFVPAKLHHLTRKLLLAIKSQAESCGC